MNSDNGLPAIHHGEFLAEILEDLAMTQANFAKAIHVSPMRVSHLIETGAALNEVQLIAA